MELAAYLKSQNVSDADFAKLIGVDRSSVTRMRNKGQIPGAKVLRKIAKATGGVVTANDFFGIKSAKPETSRPFPSQSTGKTEAAAA